MRIINAIAGILLINLLLSPAAQAAHPLVTDDTGTQGKGKFQLELTGEYNKDKENVAGVSVKETGHEAAATISYGAGEAIDLVLSCPYQWVKTEENGTTTADEDGISDTVVEAKWRFWQQECFSLALKPGIRFPTGNDEKGLGAGKVGGHLFFIGSWELDAWAIHTNLGYIRNENKADEQKNIWHASLAATWKFVKDIKLAANVGIERNPDDSAKHDPAFLLGGLIYSVTENIDFDCGVKCGINEAETDFSFLAGVALRF